MRYKIGDRVRIKSISDIGKLIDDKGYVGNLLFAHTMNKTCGMVLTVDQIDPIEEVYRMKEFPWVLYNEEMIECLVVDDTIEVSDGYHTFSELYEYRLLYNAAFFNELAKQGLYDVHKSRRHSDNDIPFGDPNWFIVMAELPTGQISNHYEMKDWDLFDIPEKETANKWDEHSPKDVAERLRKFLNKSY